MSSPNSAIKAIGHSTWSGTWKTGNGTLSTKTPTLPATPYTFSSRFTGTPGASPEELLAAALAGCFNQALANNLDMVGFEAGSIDTSVAVELGYGAEGFPEILAVVLETGARVDGIAKERFDYCAERARTHCTLARLIKLDIEMTASLLL